MAADSVAARFERQIVASTPHAGLFPQRSLSREQQRFRTARRGTPRKRQMMGIVAEMECGSCRGLRCTNALREVRSAVRSPLCLFEVDRGLAPHVPRSDIFWGTRRWEQMDSTGRLEEKHGVIPGLGDVCFLPEPSRGGVWAFGRPKTG